MRFTYVVHIAAGSIALATGYLALFASKGQRLHRRAGMAFVYSMLAMCLFGFVIAVVRNVAPTINVPAAVLTAYFVVTSLVTVRPPWAGAREVTLGAMGVAGAVSAATLSFGVLAIANGGRYEGMPAFPYFMFGIAGALGVAGDVRVLRSGALRGPARLARHLWRMSYALLIAAMSFFLGQAKVIPKPIRIPALLALPVVLVLLAMIFWLWRVRVRQAFRNLVATGAVKVA